MNEEQIIDKVSMIDQWKVSGDSYTQGELDAIGQLLELYYDNKKQLEQEKEKNKLLQSQLNGAFDRGFISKEKIKEKIKLYEEERDRADKNAYAEWGELNTWEWKNYIVEILKELLEEV